MGGLLAWANSHRWFSAVVALIAVALLGAIFSVPLRVLCIVEIPAGMVIAGLLLLPRLHLIDKIHAAVGDQMAKVASLGIGGVMLTLLAVGIKVSGRVARRANRNDNLDFSGFLDPEKMGALIGSLITLAVIAGVTIFLWKWMGIVRVIAAGYLAQFAFLIFALIVGGALKDRQDASIESRHRETMERMQRQHDAMEARRRESFERMRRQHEQMRQNLGRPRGAATERP